MSIRLEGQKLEQTENFTYLGQRISDGGRWEEDIKKRIKQARYAFMNIKISINFSKIRSKTRIQAAQMLCGTITACHNQRRAHGTLGHRHREQSTLDSTTHGERNGET